MSDLLVKTITTKNKPESTAHYWKKQLADAPKRIEFATNCSLSATGPSKPRSLQFSLPEGYSNNLNLIGNQYDANLSAVLLTAFKILLYRHTNQTDLVVGYSATKGSIDKGNLTENFGKILPIRTSLAENLYFIDLLQQVQKVADAAMLQQETVKLRPTTSSPANDDEIFHFSSNVIFAFRTETGVGNNNIFENSCENCNQVTGIELRLTLENSNDRINGVIEYHEALFEVETICGMAEHYQVLLDEIISNPVQRIAHIRILREAERNKLLFEWNKTGAEFPHDKCIHELFEEQVKISPQAIAAMLHPGVRNSFNNSDRQLTYFELNKKANQVAHYLQSMGVGPDVLVGVYMKRSLEMVIALLGILKAGGAYLPIDPGYPKDRLDFILKDSGIQILLSQYHFLNKLPAYEIPVIYLDVEWNKVSIYNDDTPVNLANPENLAYVIYTSGSTGVPKGTLIIHRGVVNYLSWCIKAYKVDEGSGCPVNSSIAFDATVTSFISPLLAGKKILLLPEQGEIEALTDILGSKSKFSLIKITPTHLEILNNLLPGKDMEEQANALVIGGEALIGKSLNFWRKHAPFTRIINEYGPTETVVGCCIYEVPADKIFTENVPIGRPIANTQIYILDNYMQPVPTGVAGEIYIGGAGLARGYLHRPELTSQRFILNPFSTDQNARLYKTGDMARYLNDGNIIFLGRADNQVKIRGYRVELEEIEHVLQQCEPVKQAVVSVKENKEGDKWLVGYYVPDAAVVKSKERELHYQWVNNWNELYEAEYSQTEGNENIDPEFDIIGWNDSFSGDPIPALQMKAWLNDIVEVILSEQPDTILEIGCGTGLIYYQLADKVKKYIGCDLSRSSINQIKERISKKTRNYCDTELFTAPAHEVMLPDDQQVDTILLNSMVQYFPGEDYMNAVMDKCMTIIKDKGRIIIGDVRDKRLLELFKGRLRIHKSNSSESIKEFKRDMEQDMIKEEELCFSPAYFYGLKNVYPQITHVDIQWKKADYINELSLYRYTVIIYIGIEKEVINPKWQNWYDIADTNNIFSDNSNVKRIIALRDVSNPRLWKEKFLHEALQDTSFKTVDEIRQVLEKEDQETVQLKQLLHIAELKGYSQKLFVHEDPFKINILFEIHPRHAFIQQPGVEKPQRTCDAKTNIPLFTDISFLLQKDIRKILLNKLPDYMVPTEFIALRQLPLTTNGKVDRLFLDGLEERKTSKTANFKEPSTTEEKILAEIWMEILSIKQISIHDDFFELGGNSIQAFRMFSRIRKTFGKNLSLGLLLKASTIDKLVKILHGNANVMAWKCLVPIQPLGSKPPLFCVHGGWGNVLFYRDLAKHLGTDQPFYGLQVKGLNGKDKPYYKMEDMAAHYIEEIRSVQSTGPYYLGGYCYGAIVAFEMAQQLLRQGQEVALLANFNGVSPLYLFPENFKKNRKIVTPLTSGKINLSKNSHKNLDTSASGRNHFLFKAKDIIQLSIRQVKGKLKNGLLKLRGVVSGLAYKAAFKFYLTSGKMMPQKILKRYILNAMSKSQGRYIPKAYPGEMVIFRSPDIYHEPHLGWSEFVTGEIKTCDIPGHHIDRRQILNEPFVEFTAKELTRFIDKYLS